MKNDVKLGRMIKIKSGLLDVDNEEHDSMHITIVTEICVRAYIEFFFFYLNTI